MKKVSLVLALFLILIPSRTLAVECTKTQVSRYEKLADQIQTTFDYTEKDSTVKFNIYFHNVNKALHLVDYNAFGGIIIYDNKDDNGIIIAPGYEQGNSYKLSVLSDGKDCNMTIVKTITVTTPNFNKYYNDPLCNGIETYSLCQKWNNIGNISYDTFKTSVNDYINKNASKNEENINAIEDTPLNNIRSFIANYYLYITFGAILLFIIIFIVYKKRKRNSW